jgi:hypothetical protein
MKELDELPRTGELRTSTHKLSAAEFARVYPHPALHLVLQVTTNKGAGGDPSKSTQEKSYERTAVIPPSGVTAQRYHDRVAFLAKRKGNPFPNMVSVGRALNNDLVVVLSTVSKLHGYFMCEGSAWTFIDHGSKNGTKINDHVLVRNERVKLAGGDRIQLGLELQAIFLTPDKLYDFLRRSSSRVLP